MNITIIHENKSKWNDFKSTYNIKGTPAFISIKNGEIKSNYSWTKENGFDFEVFMEWIKKKNRIVYMKVNRVSEIIECLYLNNLISKNIK